MYIGELSRRTGASERSLRYYEKRGLLRPMRGAGGFREYETRDVDIVRGIKTLLAAGLNTAVVGELLPCMVNGGEGLAPGCTGIVPDLDRERERIDKAVAELVAARDALESIIGVAVTPNAEDPDACFATGQFAVPEP